MTDSSPATSRAPSPPNAGKPYRFQYAESTASFSRAPESVVPDYFIGSRLDLSEINRSLEWTSTREGFNAISTVLNNPHKSQAPPKAHSSLPPLPAVQLPRVRRKDFDSYLNTIGPEYENFVNRGSQDESAPQESLPDLETVPRIFFDQNFDLTNPETFRNVTSLLSQDDVDPTDISHSLPLVDALSAFADTAEAHLSHEITSRSAAFFAALSNLHTLQESSQQTLQRVCELREKLKEVDDRNAKTGLKLVQLEVKQSRLHAVQESVEDVQNVVHKIRDMRELVDQAEWHDSLVVLDEVDKMWDYPALKLPSKRGVHRPRNLVPLKDLSAFDMLPTHLKSLQGQIAKSLADQLADVLKADLASQEANIEDKLRPILRALVQTRGVKEAVLKWRQVVLSQVIRSRFSELLPNIPLESSSSPEESSPETEQAKEDFKALPHSEFLSILRTLYSTLLRTLSSLQSQNKVVLFVLDSESAKVDFSGPIRASTISAAPTIASPTPTSAALQPPQSPLLPPSSPRLTSPSSPRLGSPIISLPPLSPVLPSRSPTLPLPTSPGFSQPPSGHSATSNLSQAIQEELGDLLSTAAEVANTLSAKLLLLHPSSQPTPSPSSKSPSQTESQPSKEMPEPDTLTPFIQTFTTSHQFILATEILSSRMIVGLRGVLTGLAKQYLSEMHKRNMERVIGRGVEEELWAPVTAVGRDVQEDGVDLVVEGAMGDVKSLKVDVSQGGSAAPQDENKEELAPKENGSASTADKPPAPRKHLHIESQSFFIVPCTSLLITRLVRTYMCLIMNIPLLTIDTMSRVVEFLKMFNGRVCQVVLGAGAMRSAGLKNITAKHLALASQTLSILITLIPYIREMFRRHLSNKQAVMLVEFDKLRRDYQEHQNEIHSKLIAIMGDRLSAHLRSLQAVNWSSPQGGINDYMIVLVKETTTLHKVLSRYLSSVVVEYVMTQVFAAINHRLSEEYGNIELPSEEAKQRLLNDARHLHSKLSELKGAGHVPTAMLEVVIQEKRVPRPISSPPPTNPSNPRSPAHTDSTHPLSSPPNPSQSPPPRPATQSPPVSELKRSSTLNFGNTNARLKGLLSGHGLSRSSTLVSPPPPPEKPSTPDEGLGFRQVSMEALKSPTMAQNGNGQAIAPEVHQTNGTGDEKVEPPKEEETTPPPVPEKPASPLDVGSAEVADAGLPTPRQTDVDLPLPPGSPTEEAAPAEDTTSETATVAVEPSPSS